MHKYMVIGISLLSMDGYISPVWADQIDTPCTTSMMCGNWWHGSFLGPIMMILFLIITGVAIVLVIRWLAGNVDRSSGSSFEQNQAINILKDRFARGEIDKEEFEEKRRTLEE